MSERAEGERRYVPLGERGGSFADVMPVPLVIDHQFARVVAVETAYLVQLEDGRMTLISYDEYCLAAERARADRWALDAAVAARHADGRTG